MRVRELLSLPAPGAKKTVVKPVVEAKPVEVVTATQVEEKKPKPAVTVEPKVEEKNTVAEIKAYLDEHEIESDGVTKKQELLDLIK